MPNEETLTFIRNHRKDDVKRLALKTVPPGVDLPAALQQIEGWQTAVRKLPSWAAHEGLLYPPRLSMEQCSSEATARYKRQVISRLSAGTAKDACRTFIDLTGGFGIDFSFLAGPFQRAVYMERQPELCRIARHNFHLLGLPQAEVVETDSTRFPESWPEADWCFIDPARRDTAGRKTVAIEDCEPDLNVLQERIRAKARFCLVKLSPMLDIRAILRTLQHVTEIHAVSVQGECREVLAVMTRERPEQEVTFHCVNLQTAQPDFVFTQAEEEEAQCLYGPPARYLYEPNASVMKCGGFCCIGLQYGLQKLHPLSHLYTSDALRTDFPGRAFRIAACSGFGKKELKALIGDIQQANLAVRNFPDSVAGLRKRLRLKEGGDTYIFATTLTDGSHVLIRCTKP